MVTFCPIDAVPGKNSVLSACAVTRAMAKSEVLPDRSDDVSLEIPSLADFPLSVSQTDLLKEQQNDSTLTEVFDRVLSISEIHDAASGYFLQNGVLFRKWVSLYNDFVGNAVFQLVVPEKFRPLVLKVAHDDCGHFGVRKTYSNILKHFFWPRVKRDVSMYIKT